MTSTVLPRVDELLQHVEQMFDVVEMQAGRRFIEDVERFSCGGADQLFGQLDPLRFAAGERRGGLPQLDVVHAHFLQAFRACARCEGMLAKNSSASATSISRMS